MNILITDAEKNRSFRHQECLFIIGAFFSFGIDQNSRCNQ